MKNKKAQTGVGLIVVVAIAVIIGLVLFQQAAVNVGAVTNTINVVNESAPSVAVNGTAFYMTSYRAINGIKIFNATGDVEVPGASYTATNNVLYNGVLATQVVPNAAMPDYKSAWKVSGTGEPLGYSENPATRSISSLVVILTALAVALVAYLGLRKVE